MDTHPPARARAHRMIWFLLPLVALLAALAPPAASAATVTLASFAIAVDDAPPVTIQPDQDDCQLSGFPPTSSTCTVNYANAETLSSTMEGDVTEPATGRTGTITLVCGWNLRMHAVSTVTISTMAMTFSELTGGGDQNCSWTIRFTDGATLNGTLVGDMALALVAATPPTEVGFTGTFSVAVIGGTGRYVNAVGTGSFTEAETMPLPTTSSGGAPTSPFATARAARAGSGSAMTLRLSKGTPRASIYSPGNNDRITATSKQTLRVFGTKGASCSAVAAKVGSSVTLGSARDATPRDGRVIFTKRLGSLPKGTWRLRATCMLPRGGALAPVRAIAYRTIVRV